MRWIITYCMICTFPFAGFSTDGNKADSLRALGLYSDAVLAYEYSAYTARNNAERTDALVQKALCYLSMENSHEAHKTMLRINYFGLNDSLHYNARYTAALLAYNDNRYEESSAQLDLVERFMPQHYQNESLLLHALALNEQRRWSEAELKLKRWIQTYASDSVKAEILYERFEKLYDEKEHPKLRDPERAVLWSTILPGSGQLFSGYIFDAAFTATMVLSGVGIAAYGILVAKYYVTGFFLGYALFQRFYISNQKRAGFVAEKRNYKSLRKYNDKLRMHILALGAQQNQ